MDGFWSLNLSFKGKRTFALPLFFSFGFFFLILSRHFFLINQ